jgi:hypothetical protein
MVPYLISMFMGQPPMAMTATERSRVLRERCAAGKAVLTVVVGEDELAGRIRRGSLDGSQGAGSGRRLVPGRNEPQIENASFAS